MLKLRLQRRGKKNYATYRVVVADAHAPIQGKFLADLGAYNPHTKALTVEAAAVEKWLKQGAQPSATVHNLLVTKGLLKADKVRSWRPKKTQPSPEATAGKKPEPEAPTTTEAK